MTKNICSIERIINKINSINKKECYDCAPCREGREWVKELLTRQITNIQEFEIYFNLVQEISIYIRDLSSCEDGKELGELILSEFTENKLDYFFHLETGLCRETP